MDNFKQYVGKRLYNQCGMDAGLIVSVETCDNIICFVVNETTSSHYCGKNSHLGIHWEVDRLNNGKKDSISIK